MTASHCILVIDVGNTATNLAVFNSHPFLKKPAIKWSWIVGTNILKRPGVFQKLFVKKIKSLSFVDLWDGAVVSSVVPSVNRLLDRLLGKSLSVRPFFVSSQSYRRVKVLYQCPSEVGADRIVNARAVRELTDRPCIVVDFGTATTFDCINRQGSFLGGVIAPGPAISAEALYRRTAQLPLVMVKKPPHILGRSTTECIQAGLFHGYRGLVKEIVKCLKTVMGLQTAVFSTGGQAQWVVRGLDIIDKNIPSLTLMGLYYVWHDLHNQRHLRRLRK